MSRTCTICGHPRRREIDGMILESIPNTTIAANSGVSEQAVRRHAKSHIPRAVVQGRENAREYDHFRKLRLLEKTLYSVLTRRLKEEDDSMVLRTHASLLRHYDFELQLGELAEIKAEIEELRAQIHEREGI